MLRKLKKIAHGTAALAIAWASRMVRNVTKAASSDAAIVLAQAVAASTAFMAFGWVIAPTHDLAVADLVAIFIMGTVVWGFTFGCLRMQSEGTFEAGPPPPWASRPASPSLPPHRRLSRRDRNRLFGRYRRRGAQ